MEVSSKALLWGIALIAVVAVAYVLFSYSPHQNESATMQKIASYIGVPARSGNIDEALQSYRSTFTDPSATAREKAGSTLLGASLAYRASGNVKDAIQGIQDLKKTASDTSVSAFLRAYAMLEMGLLLSNARQSKDAFDAVFADPAYSKYIISNEDGSSDKLPSIRNLLIASFQISPLYRGAIAIAANAVSEIYTKDNAGIDFDPAGSLSLAEEYLARAEDLAVKQSANQPTGSDRYENYLSEHAFVVGALAELKGAPYADQYKKVFEDEFAFLQKEQATYADAKGKEAVERATYARFLISIDNDTAAAREQSKQALALNADVSNPTKSLTQWIKTIKQKSGTAPGKQILKLLKRASPEFKAFVDSVQ